MKQYTLTIKFQVEDPENSKDLKHLIKDIEEHNAENTMTFGTIKTTEVKLEENADNIQI